MKELQPKLEFAAPIMKDSAKPSDEELLPLIINGDASAFEMLYERRQGGIYRYALRMSGSEAVAEDVTQDVFMALMRDAGLYDSSRGPVVSYLYGLARHRVLRRLKRERAFVSIKDEEEEGGETLHNEQLIAQDDPLDRVIRDEVVESVRQAILALPAHYREAIILCHLQEMDYAEAATVIGCAIGTVRSRLHRARILLIEKLRAMKEADSYAQGLQSAIYIL